MDKVKLKKRGDRLIYLYRGGIEKLNDKRIKALAAIIILCTDGGSGSRRGRFRSSAEESPGAAGQDTAGARGP